MKSTKEYIIKALKNKKIFSSEEKAIKFALEIQEKILIKN